MIKKRVFVYIFLIILLSIPALKALTIPEFYTNHDGVTHTARIANYYLAIKEGQIPPRLAPTLFGGLGFPMFIFIYPLPYFLASAVHAIGFSFTDSFEIIIGASFLLSAVTMFIFLRELFDELPAFVGALFYAWAPYRFSQLYVRAAIAESFAYIFVPLVFLSLLKLARTSKTRWVGIGSLSFAGLLLSHHLVSLMFLPVLALFGLVFLKETQNKRKYLLFSAIIAIIGLATAAFIYLPSIFERKFLRFDQLIDYSAAHFVTIKQLIRSPWSYGFSMPGSLNDDMSFQVGLTHLLVVALSTVSLLFILLKHKRSAVKTPFFWIGSMSLLVFAVSVGLMLEHPAVLWIWKHFPDIVVIDFPWRLLGVSVFSASLLAAYLIATLPFRPLLLGVLLFFVFYANRNHLRINQTLVRNDEYFLNYFDTATYRNEFLTNWRQTNKLEHLEENYSVKEGDISITEVETKTNRIILEVKSQKEGRIDIHRLYFPGWRVFLDGRPLKLGKDYEISSEIQIETETTPYIDRSGFLTVRVPSGTHTIKVQFTETPIRKTGFALSGIGLLLSLGLTKQNNLRLSGTGVKRKRKR